MQYDTSQFTLGGAFYTTDGEGVTPSPLPTVVVETFDLAAGTSAQVAGSVTAGQVTGLYWCRHQIPSAGSYNIGFRFLTSDATVDSKEIVAADYNGTSDNATSSIVVTTAAATLITLASVPGAIAVYRGDTWSFLVGNALSLAGVTDAWITVKQRIKSADSKAIVKIRETVGLEVIDATTAITAANGSISANASDYTVVLNAVESAKLEPGSYEYDLQLLRSGAIETAEIGTFQIIGDVTRATS